MENKSSVAIGIDLGTTNTCTAVYRNGMVEVIPNRLGAFLTPSWVAYTDKEVVIGKVAKKNAYKNVNGTLYAIKRLIGRKYKDSVVQDSVRNWKFKIQEDNSGIPKIEIIIKNEKKYVYPEEVSGLLLREMKEIAEAHLGEENIRDVVITVPAYFNDHQRQATKDAAKIAGLNVLRLINEPTAAAIAYIYNKPEKEEHNVLVYDLGGGTFDVSIVSLEGCNVRVKATRGDTNLGGTNFDERCIMHFVKLITAKYNIDIQDAVKLKLLQRLRNAVENAKHDLSTAVTSTIELDSIYSDVDLAEEFTRARFNDLNEDLFKKTLSVVEQCIREAKLEKGDIDDIVLVGGSTRILRIQEMLRNFFGKPASKAINPDQAVAHGAAILAAKLSGTLPLVLNIMDVTPMSLGIDTLSGTMDILIKRNTQIPIEAQKQYTTGVEGDNAVRITILEGDSRLAKRNLKLGYFDLLHLPKKPSVNVTFKVDIDGIVTVSAEETSSGISKTTNINLNKGRLSDKEISILRVNSNLVKDSSRKWQQIIEKRNEFESYILQLRFDVTKNTLGMTNKQQTLALDVIDEAFSWMTTENAFNVEQLERKQDSINSYCEMLRPSKPGL